MAKKYSTFDIKSLWKTAKFIATSNRFQQGHGTQHDLFPLPQSYQKEFDESDYSGAVLMDLSKP